MTTIFDLISGISQSRRMRDGYSLEVEAEFSEPPNNPMKFNNWRITQDGSLRGHGYEFITTSPLPIKDQDKNLAELFDQEYFKNYIPSHRTSTHVHANVQNWTMPQLMTFLVTYYLCEPLLTQWGGKQREGNLFCLRLCDAEKSMDAVKLLIDEDFYKLLARFDTYKYAGLNVANVSKIGTVEFRQMRGTNDPQLVKTWLDAIDNLINFSRKFDTPEDALYKYVEDPVDFIGKATNNLEPVVFIDRVDQNYSLVFDLVHYMSTKEERMVALQSKKANSNKPSYKFARENDLVRLD